MAIETKLDPGTLRVLMKTAEDRALSGYDTDWVNVYAWLQGLNVYAWLQGPLDAQKEPQLDAELAAFSAVAPNPAPCIPPDLAKALRMLREWMLIWSPEMLMSDPLWRELAAAYDAAKERGEL